MIINWTLTGLLCDLSHPQASIFPFTHTIALPSAVPFSLLLQLIFTFPDTSTQHKIISPVWIDVITEIYTPQMALWILGIAHYLLWDFSVGARGKEPACQMQKTYEIQVQSLSQENPLEEDMATHSSILPWRIAMDGGVWRATVHRVTQSWTWLKQLSTARQLPFIYRQNI